MLVRLSSAIAALALTATAGAATISGTIFDDPRAYAVRSELRPAASATVMLYRDSGLVTSATTAENGAYSFPSVADGSYWIPSTPAPSAVAQEPGRNKPTDRSVRSATTAGPRRRRSSQQVPATADASQRS